MVYADLICNNVAKINHELRKISRRSISPFVMCCTMYNSSTSVVCRNVTKNEKGSGPNGIGIFRKHRKSRLKIIDSSFLPFEIDS